VASVVTGLVAAAFLDSVSGRIGYTVVFVIGGILGAADMVCYGFTDDIYTTPPAKLSIRPVIKSILKDKPFFRFIVFWTVWCFTANLGGGYLSRYALGEMGLTNMQYTLFAQVASALTTVLVIAQWGKMLDRFGNKPIMWVSCIATSLTQAFYLFSVPGSIWPTLLHNVVGAFFWSASNLAATNMQLSSSPDKERASYIAVFSCITSILGSFLGVMAGGVILDTIQNSEMLTKLIPDRYKFLVILGVSTRFLGVLLLLPGLDGTGCSTVKEMFGELFSKKYRRRI